MMVSTFLFNLINSRGMLEPVAGALLVAMDYDFSLLLPFMRAVGLT